MKTISDNISESHNELNFDSIVAPPFEFRYSLKKNIFCRVEDDPSFIDNNSLRKKDWRVGPRNELYKNINNKKDDTENPIEKEERKKEDLSHFYRQLVPQLEKICMLLEDFTILNKVKI